MMYIFFIPNIRFIDIFLLPFQGYLKNLISLHLMRAALLNIETKYLIFLIEIHIFGNSGNSFHQILILLVSTGHYIKYYIIFRYVYKQTI